MTYKITRTTNILLSGILFVCIALGTTGCNEDFLTTVPTDRVSSATFWSNERDFNTALNGTYNEMTGQDLDPLYFDGTTDIGYSHADWRRQHEYVMGRANAQSGWSGGLWAQMYTGISRANEILFQLEEVGGDVLSQEAANRIRGEALFLRGYFYHELLWMFGEVPVFTSVPTVEEARSVSRSSREDVYTRITTDLSEAASLLPTRAELPSSDFGRATSEAAVAYHARTALYEASWQENHEGNNSRANTLYGTARDMAATIMNDAAYSHIDLHPNFRDLFTYAGEQSQEIILDYQKVSGQNGWSAWADFAPKSMGSEVNIAPTRELVNRFPMEDGLSIEESSMYDDSPPEITYDGNGNPTVQTLGMYADRDPRFYGTVLFPGAQFNGIVYNSYPSCSESNAPDGYCSPTGDRIQLTDYNNTYTGYTAMKYVDPQDESSPTNSGINFIKMRYADVLLMYAEAKIELGEQDQSVNDAIQEIRDRVDLPYPQDVTTMTQQEAIDFIRNERIIELAWEGLHLADIRRWNTAENVLNGNTHGIDIADGGSNFSPVPGQHTRSFEAPRDYLWPIPSSERDLNSNLEQNPGY
ncbi:RagB/SusD family nutrient uptake outer membrane protein [Aliifodinibius salicampi]|uniref:RagB/SusD family nutrient uptake outer membrane protein n=1 Tax=Fodinibius salicampi TaxID=1920655 RepID=A0ABT3PTZ7_9BACT|nr:RagB/SusD family nutrient uptake outer membrane protein [Fodinibius salicampi]MCW9711330.1 RagB/SusD family nutrient uptake outer membrane protein [Fodinibius salicampi]